MLGVRFGDSVRAMSRVSLVSVRTGVGVDSASV